MAIAVFELLNVQRIDLWILLLQGLNVGTVSSKACHEYNHFWDTWSPVAELEKERDSYGLVQINDNDFWITGELSRAKNCGIERNRCYESKISVPNMPKQCRVTRIE